MILRHRADKYLVILITAPGERDVAKRRELCTSLADTVIDLHPRGGESRKSETPASEL